MTNISQVCDKYMTNDNFTICYIQLLVKNVLLHKKLTISVNYSSPLSVIDSFRLEMAIAHLV